MSIREFLKELPSHDEQNFSLFCTENGIRPMLNIPSVYVPTVDHPSEQIIVTDDQNILLRYLDLQWEKKNPKKRENSTIPESTEFCARKRLRLE